jgi:hypothetical protein
MIYWEIKQPGKSWRTWSSGTASDIGEAQVDAMFSVMDDDNQLLPWTEGGVNVQMWECVDTDDWEITKERAKKFRTNYLGLIA